MDQAFVEAEISYAVANLAVLHVESSVARHPRKNFFVGINLADVPESRDQHAVFG